MIAFRNVVLVGRQLNSSVMRWLSSQVALCAAGVGQCGSLKGSVRIPNRKVKRR